MPTLPLSPDELLTTTRTVRKRLDLTRPVPLDLVRECLEVALQAPSGSNQQGWQWVVIVDEAQRRAVGDIYRDGGGRVTLRMYESLKPIIAAVNGPAVGVGVTMQLPMDIRLASTEARFGFVFARRGLNPEAASSWFLPHLVGPQTALEWCFTGRVFPAAEAKEKGLVRSLHAPDELLPAARALAREIADNTAPVSIAITRQLIWRMTGAAHPMEAHLADSRGIQLRGAQKDVREGVGAFLEKRPPRFPDKVSSDLPDIWPQWSAPTFR